MRREQRSKIRRLPLFDRTLVPDLVRDLALGQPELLADPLGHARGGNPPGLGHPDHKAVLAARAGGRVPRVPGLAMEW